MAQRLVVGAVVGEKEHFVTTASRKVELVLKSFLVSSQLFQIVSRLVQIRDYIAKASSMRDDLVEKNERSANVERLSHLINHLKQQEKSYLKFLQKILVSVRMEMRFSNCKLVPKDSVGDEFKYVTVSLIFHFPTPFIIVFLFIPLKYSRRERMRRRMVGL